MTDRYAAAGVHLDTADEAKRRIAELVRQTRTELALGALGAFGGMVRLPPGYERPVLVLSTDGVGTKVLVAARAGVHDTVGEDLVNHCVNDILVHGARPLAFLDYIATGTLEPETAAAIVAGVARGCGAHDMTLAGGETAQLPDLYRPGQYDVAGAIVGVVEERAALHGDRVRAGDVLLGYASNGLHTNGYSLARKILFERAGYSPNTFVPELKLTIAEELLKVHRSYLQPIRKLLASGILKGAAHITGGGITDNTPRMLPPKLGVEIDLSSWTPPPVFEVLRTLGDIPTDDLRRTFNLGIGMILAVSRKNLPKTESLLRRMKEPYYVIGSVVPRKPGLPRVAYR